MKRQACGHADTTNSCHRIIKFNSSSGNSQDLSVEEQACLAFLEKTIESIATEDDDVSSDDAQSSENTISKSQHITCASYEDKSSCNSFLLTGRSQDLSVEEKACLKFLEKTIDSIQDGGLSTDHTGSLPESRYTTGKKHHIDQMNNFLVPTPLILPASNGNGPPKQGMAFCKEIPMPNKGNIPQKNQPSSEDAFQSGLLSYDGLVEKFKNVSIIKASFEKRPTTHGDQMYSKKTQDTSESHRSKPKPPPIAPKPKNIPPPSENCSLRRPDKAKLEALSKVGLLKKDVMPEKQDLDALLSNQDCPQKDQLEKSGMKVQCSVSNDEQSALQKLSNALRLSLPKVPDPDEDRRWALRKLGLLED